VRRDHDDRTVHASGLFLDVVRYNRAGKWYLEGKGDNQGYRRHVGIREAARFAAAGCDVHLGLPGGSTFDQLVKDEANA
jgi:hypothetical protein